jgi:cell division septation protein DedD
MDDQTSWRGHNFTLLIFGGVVVLCSIFFILGMLVGRAQVESVVQAATVEPQPSSSQETDPADPDEFDLTFYESVEQDAPPPLESVPTVDRAITLEASRASAPSDLPQADARITLQIAALSNAEQAGKLLEEVRARGFGKAFILGPAPGDRSGLHRVQVGPFSEAEADRVQRQLEAQGYKPIVKR